MTIYAKFWPTITNWLKGSEKKITQAPQPIAGVSPVHQSTRPKAYAATRTRLKALQTKFIGAGSRSKKAKA